MYCTYSSKHCSRQHGHCLILLTVCAAAGCLPLSTKTKNDLAMSISGPLVESMFL